jgi:hypothetical protein
MTDTDVRCGTDGSGWRCAVRVTDGGRSSTFDVTTRDPTAFLPDTTRPSATDIERLVRETFAFLLERESVTSILSTFDLTVVTRYFPEYPEEIRRRMPHAS